MADTKVQNQTSEQQQRNQSSGQQQTNQSSQQQRGMTRRQDYSPSRDPFYFSPFSMMRRMSEEMDRAFSSNFGLGRWFGDESGRWSPAVEVRERNGNLEICAELPGMEKDDVKVETTEEGVVIEGEKRREHESDEGGYHRSERSYGHFYRMIPLPEGAQIDKATADFKNGVLQVKVPVPESQQQQKSRRIPINS
jgi:HSP20 family protein